MLFYTDTVLFNNDKLLFRIKLIITYKSNETSEYIPDIDFHKQSFVSIKKKSRYLCQHTQMVWNSHKLGLFITHAGN